MASRLCAFVVWFAVAASMVFWGLRLMSGATAAPAHTTVAAAVPAPRGELARLLGVDAPVSVPGNQEAPPEPPPDARFQLIGVVAPRGAGGQGQGVALLALDGKLPRAYRVGTVVDGRLVLQSVHARGAALGPRGEPASVKLELPPPQAAATGSLPAAVNAEGPAAPAARAPQPAGLAPRANNLPLGLPRGNLPAQPGTARMPRPAVMPDQQPMPVQPDDGNNVQTQQFVPVMPVPGVPGQDAANNR